MDPVHGEELVAAAAVFEDRAARLEALADTLATRAATAAWAGPAADRFRLVMMERRNELRAGAFALRDAADAMRSGAA